MQHPRIGRSRTIIAFRDTMAIQIPSCTAAKELDTTSAKAFGLGRQISQEQQPQAILDTVVAVERMLRAAPWWPAPHLPASADQ